MQIYGPQPYGSSIFCYWFRTILMSVSYLVLLFWLAGWLVAGWLAGWLAGWPAGWWLAVAD
jgi:hypothetical protein